MKGRSPFDKTLCGVGYRGIMQDGSIPPAVINKKKTREYKLWSAMINRCYSKNSYDNCIVCERWHSYANFLEDLTKIDGYEYWYNNPGKRICLDKDVKQQDVKNKIYSLETCCFIDNEKNSQESALRNGLGRDRKKTAIIAIDLETGDELYFESQQEAARQLQCNQSNIHKCLVGKVKQTKGFSFKYLKLEG